MLHFSQCFRYRWVHPSGALIGSYSQSMRGQALLRFHTGGSNVSPNQTLPECRKDKRIVDDLLVAELAKSSGICWRFIGSLGDFRYGFSLTLRHSGSSQRGANWQLHVGSRQLLPPSGKAQTEGISPKKVHFIGENASQRCLFRYQEAKLKSPCKRLAPNWIGWSH